MGIQLRNTDILFNDGTALATSPFPVSDATVLNQLFGAGQTSTTVTYNRFYLRRYAYWDSFTGAYYGNGDSGYQTYAGVLVSGGKAGWSIQNRILTATTVKSTAIPSRGMRMRITGSFAQNTDDYSITRITNNYGYVSEQGWGGAWGSGGTAATDINQFVQRTHQIDVDIPNAFCQAGITWTFAARITGGSGQEESWGVYTTTVAFLNWL